MKDRLDGEPPFGKRQRSRFLNPTDKSLDAIRRGPAHISESLTASLQSLIDEGNRARRALGLPPYGIDETAAGSPRRRFERLFASADAATAGALA